MSVEDKLPPFTPKFSTPPKWDHPDDAWIDEQVADTLHGLPKDVRFVLAQQGRAVSKRMADDQARAVARFEAQRNRPPLQSRDRPTWEEMDRRRYPHESQRAIRQPIRDVHQARQAAIATDMASRQQKHARTDDNMPRRSADREPPNTPSADGTPWWVMPTTSNRDDAQRFAERAAARGRYRPAHHGQQQEPTREDDMGVRDATRGLIKRTRQRAEDRRQLRDARQTEASRDHEAWQDAHPIRPGETVQEARARYGLDKADRRAPNPLTAARTSAAVSGARAKTATTRVTCQPPDGIPDTGARAARDASSDRHRDV